ncbi:MAG: zinc dependent phospholipase C family protein [Sphingobacteriales bacterium]|nr:zinc dependent phospholipase C family protein [Sphingobacteriales bacterium]
MRKITLFITILVLLGTTFVFSWGFFAHKRVNRLAVFTLPKELIGFYKSNIDFITEQAVAPDKRRYSDKEEAPRHYLDADHYDLHHPFDSIPTKWKEAVAKYSEDTLKAYGTVPWRIQERLAQLTQAFKERDSAKILFYSADLGHYVADACVPLHSTENYDGQMSGQKGLHGFWESRLPELFADDYYYWVGKATYIADPLDESFKLLKGSFAALDSVFKFEKELTEKMGKDKKYSFEQRGNKNIQVYSYDFSKAYHEQLDGMVERRMRVAIKAVGSYWYTAWVNAGQPNMKKLINKSQSDTEKEKAEKDEAAFQNGKALGRVE